MDVYSEVFAIICHGIDVNKDGTYDCLASGRLGTLVAINPKNGNLLTPEFHFHSIFPCFVHYLFCSIFLSLYWLQPFLLGELLWTTDKMKLHDGWNIYSPATVQDLNYDGVGEIVIAHGGDPVIPAEVCICIAITQ